MRAYFILAVQCGTDEPWSIEFGDYSRRVVVQEMRDLMPGWPGCRFQILQTKDDQRTIEEAVRELNSVFSITPHTGKRKAAR